MSNNGAAEAIDTSASSPRSSRRRSGKTPDDQLREAMKGPMRDQIIGEIFKRMEEHYRGGGQSAVIHWKITGRPDGGEDVWEAVVSDGTCSTSSAPESEPRVTLKISSSRRRSGSGRGNWSYVIVGLTYTISGVLGAGHHYCDRRRSIGWRSAAS